MPNYIANVTADSYVQRSTATINYITDETIKNKNGSGSADTDRTIIMKLEVNATISSTITSATLNVYG